MPEYRGSLTRNQVVKARHTGRLTSLICSKSGCPSSLLWLFFKSGITGNCASARKPGPPPWRAATFDSRLRLGVAAFSTHRLGRVAAVAVTSPPTKSQLQQSTTVTLSVTTPRADSVVPPPAPCAPCPAPAFLTLRSTARAAGERGGGPGQRRQRHAPRNGKAVPRRRVGSGLGTALLLSPADSPAVTRTKTRAHALTLFRTERARRAGAGQLCRRWSTVTPASLRFQLACGYPSLPPLARVRRPGRDRQPVMTKSCYREPVMPGRIG